MTKTASWYWLAAALVVLGMTLAGWAITVQFRAHDDIEDMFSWVAWCIGLAIVAAGLSLPFFHWHKTLRIALMIGAGAYPLVVAAYWCYIFVRIAFG